jgi:hypothetical protein
MHGCTRCSFARPEYVTPRSRRDRSQLAREVVLVERNGRIAQESGVLSESRHLERSFEDVDHQAGINVHEHEIAIDEPILQLRWKLRQRAEYCRPHRYATAPWKSAIYSHSAGVGRSLLVEVSQKVLDVVPFGGQRPLDADAKQLLHLRAKDVLRVGTGPGSPDGIRQGIHCRHNLFGIR